LPHRAFALQTSQNHGLQKVAPLRSLITYASANICYAPAAAHPTMFCPLSPEAGLLTKARKQQKIIMLIPQSRESRFRQKNQRH